jgi:hypothetical protein
MSLITTKEMSGIPQEVIDKILGAVKEKNLRMRSAKTNKKDVKTREGKKKKVGDVWVPMVFKYVSWGTAAKQLDIHYPGWSWEIIPGSFQSYGGYINCLGKLTVIESGRFQRVITEPGSMEIRLKQESNEPVVLDYYKAAASDAFKRCCARLGFFNDLYQEDSFDSSEVADETEINRFYEEILPELINLVRSEGKFKAKHLFNVINKFVTGELKVDEIKNIYGV